ncbi:unnamed protein product, partial [Musa acuminata var. zebrina]
LNLKKKVDILSSTNAKFDRTWRRNTCHAYPIYIYIYIYNLLSHEYINYRDSKDSYTLKH